MEKASVALQNKRKENLWITAIKIKKDRINRMHISERALLIMEIVVFKKASNLRSIW